MVVTVAALVAGRRLLPGFFTEDASVIVLAAATLPIAGVFQVADRAQVVGSGILRGMGKTVPVALINLVGVWVVAPPSPSSSPSARTPGSPGLTAGLTVVTGLLVLWIRARGPASLLAPTA